MILRAKNIAKSYLKTPVLAGISLSISQGQSMAIRGRSGEGKTTLLHILGTLEEPDSGEVEICGQKLTRSNAATLRNQQIGFVFQTYNLLEDFTLLENILMPARIARRFPEKKKGMELLERLGLVTQAHLPVKHLSGGERQRAAIARALCNQPNLILADEPSGNLDRENAQIIGQILISLVKEEKKSLILVTHDAELAALCDQQMLLQNGHLTPLF
jgi:lipoprotein-releasing system ATP-binding protein